ncbi:MAG: o-succinylbenzoate synthase [Opitutaceae bacterium]
MYTLTWKRYRRPFRQPLVTGHGTWDAREGILVRLEDCDGRIGYGEVAPIPWFGTETIESAAIQLSLLGSTVNPEVMGLIPGSYPCCRAAVGAALTDLVGPGYPRGKRLPVAALLPAGQTAFSVLEERLNLGFLTAKLKIGMGDPDQEKDRVERLCRLLPEGGGLRLDANGILDAARAAVWLEFVADLPVEFIEQPVPPEDVEALLGLAADFPTPIALDESVVRVDDLKRWRDRGWPGLYVIKPALAGDPDELQMEIGQDEVFVFSTAMETAIGHRGSLRAAFQSASKRALGFGVGAFFADQVDEPFLSSDRVGGIDLEFQWKRLTGS